ncbi:caspase family protein [Streptomyces apricus]|uniref:Caspase family protein n=1 Tax=Streptomyces apricus TaxID=1828112 RepID=A0A5B0AUQ2_9ACTN|nr:caspase family protein [Streptomyces apricus]KAA0932229.1 caspase family protein [Streptomyces apricus]
MQLSDPATSEAVLIGNYSYTQMEDLPAVSNNVERLAELLCDSKYWGLPSKNCTKVAQASRDDILDSVHKATVKAVDTLIFYFAGHGLIHPTTGELYLGVAEAAPGLLFKALRYGDVRDLILGEGSGPRIKARKKVVILDCCWSGLALDGGMSAGDRAGQLTNIAGTYILTATAETKQALAPPGERYTAFTGELISVIEEGIIGASELISMASLYDETYTRLTSRSLPEPQQRNRNNSGFISIFRNIAHRDGLPSPGRVSEQNQALQSTPTNPAREDLMNGSAFEVSYGLARSSGTFSSVDQLLADSNFPHAINEDTGKVHDDEKLKSLAWSLHARSRDLAEANQQQQAMATAQEALEIHRNLANRDPDTHLEGLADYLESHVYQLQDFKQRKAAIAASQEALEIRRRLAKINPEKHLESLARSLDFHSRNLADASQRDAAMATAQEALEIHRNLANRDPDTHLEGLADYLESHVYQLKEMGLKQEALAVSEEAISIRRRLAR